MREPPSFPWSLQFPPVAWDCGEDDAGRGRAMTSTRHFERSAVIGSRLAGRLRSRAVVVPVGLWTVAHAAIFGWALAVREAALLVGGHAIAVSPAALFFHWDSAYFASIAEHGYIGHGTSTTWSAFFPGFPLAARLVAAMAGAPHPDHQQVVIALEAVAGIASLAATVLLYRLAGRHYGEKVATAATVAFVLGPYALFLAAPYSEALFVAFALGAWLCAERGRWWAAGLLGAAASLTRVEGLFLVAGVAVAVAVELRKRGEPFLLKALGTAAVGSAGALAYWGALWVWTGNPIAWFTAQHVGWHRSLNWPWASLLNTVESLFVPPWPHQVQNTVDLVFASLLVTTLVVLIRRRQWAFATYVGLTAAAMMTSTTYMSIARSTAVLFPVAIVVATTTTDARKRWIYRCAIGAGVVLLAFNTALFVNSVWVD